MPEFLAARVARMAFRLVRYWILNRSDQAIAQGLKVLRRLVYAVSGDEFLRDALGEGVQIFEESGWGTETVREMLREADDYGVVVLKSVLSKD